MGHDLDAYADLKSERDFERLMRNKFEQLATNLQSELATLKAAHAWIKTSERLSELNTPVLGIDERGDIDVLECVPTGCGGTEWQYVTGHHGSVGAVTHWMPLPVRPR